MTAIAERDPDRINFDWLIRLRWAAIVGQLVTIGAVHFAMQLDIPIAPLLVLVGVEIGSNLVCATLARRRRPRQAWLAAVMALDVVLFSALLYLTGGPNNPFSFLYLIPIALASITVRAAWTWALVALSLACSGFLFAAHEPLPLGDHARHMSLHLQGMWVAFGVAAAFIVYFLLRVRRALERHEARAGRGAGGGPAPGAARVAGDAGRGRRPRAGDAAVDHRGGRQRSRSAISRSRARRLAPSRTRG